VANWGQPVAQGPSPGALVRAVRAGRQPRAPGILYGHNDSGDTARFFAITEQAQVNAELHLTGDPTATGLGGYLRGSLPERILHLHRDTGDNKADRTEYVIHRIAEPATLPSDGGVTP